MAKGVNKVFSSQTGQGPRNEGHAGRMTIANFTLATSDRTKDAQGNWQDHTEWHNLVAFQRTAEIVRDYCKKARRSSSKARSRPVPGKIRRVIRSTGPRFW